MLLDSSERNLVVEAFRAGASGVFSRDDSFELLARCVQKFTRVRSGPMVSS